MPDRKKIETREKKVSNVQAAREFELKKLESQATNNTATARPLPTDKNNLLKVMAKFELPRDMYAYLSICECQITRIGVNKENWVCQLLGLLHLEIVQFIS